MATLLSQVFVMILKTRSLFMNMIILIESASALLRTSGTNRLRDRLVLGNNSFLKTFIGKIFIMYG